MAIITLVILFAVYGLGDANEDAPRESSDSPDSIHRQKDFQDTLSKIDSFLEQGSFKDVGTPMEHSRERRGFPLLGTSTPLPEEPAEDPNFAKGSWESAIVEALNNMKVGIYAAKSSNATFKFQLTVCKNGRIKTIAKKGGSLPQDGQNAIRLSLEQLQLPKPPPRVAAKMRGSCAKIRYTFTWTPSGIK